MRAYRCFSRPRAQVKAGATIGSSTSCALTRALHQCETQSVVCLREINDSYYRRRQEDAHKFLRANLFPDAPELADLFGCAN
eukprot:6038303-Amphidinium_carterae.1